MTEPAALALHCPNCGGPVTVQFENWDDHDDQRLASCPCPWCDKVYEFQAPGRFLWITKGHEPAGPTG